MPLAWCTAAGALLLCVAAVTVARYVQVAEALRERLGSLGEEVARGDQERVRLTGENTRLTEERRRALAERDAALASFANAAGRMQALSTGMLADLRAMQERHSDEDVLADLFHLGFGLLRRGSGEILLVHGGRAGSRGHRPLDRLLDPLDLLREGLLPGNLLRLAEVQGGDFGLDGGLFRLGGGHFRIRQKRRNLKTWKGRGDDAVYGDMR